MASNEQAVTLLDSGDAEPSTLQVPQVQPASDAATEQEEESIENSSHHFQLLATIITDLVGKNTKRTHTNLISALSEHNIESREAEELINAALQSNLMYSYNYAKQVNYKQLMAGSSTAVISDPVLDAQTDTDDISPRAQEISNANLDQNINCQYVKAEDFLDFKNEMLEINRSAQENLSIERLRDVEKFKEEVLENINSQF